MLEIQDLEQLHHLNILPNSSPHETSDIDADLVDEAQQDFDARLYSQGVSFRAGPVLQTSSNASVDSRIS